MSERILVVEDDLDLHFILTKMLMKGGYQVQSAYSGREAKNLIERDNFDLIILDLMLPEVSGEELIDFTRQSKVTPILVTSSKVALDDRIAVLERGADDYLVKPFEQGEVLARVKALLRRSQVFSKKEVTPERLAHKKLVLDTVGHQCFIDDVKITLTSKEFELLELFLKNPSKVFTKEQLYSLVWGNDLIVEDNSINVHISNLRKKIKKYDSAEYIETIWGIGFKLITD